MQELGDTASQRQAAGGHFVCVFVQELSFHFILIFKLKKSEKLLILQMPQFLAISYTEYHSESVKTSSLNHPHAVT